MKKKIFLVWVAILFLVLTIVTCCLPYIFTQNGVINFTETGQIGDTIGGTMGPFVGLIAAFLTFLAFWIQYEANQEQKNSIAENRKEIIAQQERYELDRFESKLTMMMNSYQENVKSIECGGSSITCCQGMFLCCQSSRRRFLPSSHHVVPTQLSASMPIRK